MRVERIVKKAAFRLRLRRMIRITEIFLLFFASVAVLLSLAHVFWPLSPMWLWALILIPAGGLTAFLWPTDWLKVAIDVDAANAYDSALSNALAFKDSEDPFKRAHVESVESDTRAVDVAKAVPIPFPKGIILAIPLFGAAALSFVFLPQPAKKKNKAQETVTVIEKNSSVDEKSEKALNPSSVDAATAAFRSEAIREIVEKAEGDPETREMAEALSELLERDARGEVDAEEFAKKLDEIIEKIEEKKDFPLLEQEEREKIEDAISSAAANMQIDKIAKELGGEAEKQLKDFKKALEEKKYEQAAKNLENLMKNIDVKDLDKLAKLAKLFENFSVDMRQIDPKLKEAIKKNKDLVEALKKKMGSGKASEKDRKNLEKAERDGENLEKQASEEEKENSEKNSEAKKREQEEKSKEDKTGKGNEDTAEKEGGAEKGDEESDKGKKDKGRDKESGEAEKDQKEESERDKLSEKLKELQKAAEKSADDLRKKTEKPRQGEETQKDPERKQDRQQGQREDQEHEESKEQKKPEDSAQQQGQKGNKQERGEEGREEPGDSGQEGREEPGDSGRESRQEQKESEKRGEKGLEESLKDLEREKRASEAKKELKRQAEELKKEMQSQNENNPKNLEQMKDFLDRARNESGGKSGKAEQNRASEKAEKINPGFKDESLRGMDSPTSVADTIKSTSEKGFATTAYKDVYENYEKAAEEIIEKEQIPPGYKQYIQQYFEYIRPRE